MIDTMSVLAQDSPATPAPQSGGQFLFLALMVGMVVFMVLTSRSQRKREQRERESMLSRLSKNDRVLTVGGVIGTIVSIKDDEVVLKVDESTNTKMTFLKTAVQRILNDEPALTGQKS